MSNTITNPLTRIAINTNCVQEQIDLIKSNLEICAETIQHKIESIDDTEYYALRLLVKNLSDVWDLCEDIEKDISELMRE